jgi:hypothetical protein
MKKHVAEMMVKQKITLLWSLKNVSVYFIGPKNAFD